jgi:hypothetical protein
MLEKQMDKTCIGPCPMAGYDISSVELLGSATRVYWLDTYLVCYSFRMCYPQELPNSYDLLK